MEFYVHVQKEAAMENTSHDAWRQNYLSDDSLQHPISVAVARAIERCACVAVLGYGISNRPLVDILLALGARVVVYDQKTLDALGEQAQTAAAVGATVRPRSPSIWALPCCRRPVWHWVWQ